MPVRGVYAQNRTESSKSVSSAEGDAVRDQVDRILADPLFSNSKRYTGLLRFIAERTLEGRSEDLKERVIGVEVFGRTPDYDTSLDATVRVAATEIRKRLALYYKEPGREQELRIEVPNGSYVAEFRLPQQKERQAEPVIGTPLTVKAPVRRKLWYTGVALGVVALVFAAWGLSRTLSPKPLIDQFWAPVLAGAGPVTLYLSAPPNDLLDAVTPSTQPPSQNSGEERFHEFIKHRNKLPAADVNGAASLSSFLQRKGKQSVVRPSFGVNLSDLRSAPAVLLGAYYNDWAMRLGDSLPFRFRRESPVGLRWIEDSANPKNRNWAMDFSVPYGQVNEDYALISRVLDQITGRWLIVIGGLTGSGTTAACEFVTDPMAVAALGGHLPRDWGTKNLQIVLAVKLVQGNPGASKVMAAKSW